MHGVFPAYLGIPLAPPHDVPLAHASAPPMRFPGWMVYRAEARRKKSKLIFFVGSIVCTMKVNLTICFESTRFVVIPGTLILFHRLILTVTSSSKRISQDEFACKFAEKQLLLKNTNWIHVCLWHGNTKDWLDSLRSGDRFNTFLHCNSHAREVAVEAAKWHQLPLQKRSAIFHNLQNEFACQLYVSWIL